jgi:ABC-type cobalamin/Fe3+-siderophores transport system ATPase subunit
MQTNDTTAAIPTFRFKFPQDIGLPTIGEREFGRITVLLGANGSGKSRLLRALATVPRINGAQRSVVYVEGGRAIRFPEHIDIGSVDASYTAAQGSSLTTRIEKLLAMLEVERSDTVSEYQAALYRWVNVDKEDPEKRPVEKPSRLKRINEVFSRLLPRRAFSMTPKSRTPLTDKRAMRLRNWYLENNGVTYDIGTLSDGEKQVLCLLADVGELSPEKALILVDEPELNLHPSLAAELWNGIEQSRSDAVFVYATHSLSFALRPSVTDIVVLGAPTQEPLHLRTAADLSSDDLEPFLGSIAAIVTSKRVLVVEGEDGRAFDKGFYRWLVGTDAAIVNVGDCHKVRSAINHEGIWQKAGKVAICGIVDRDFRTDSRLAGFSGSGCEVLAYHEAESYLCYPQLLADASHLAGVNVTIDAIIDRMVQLCLAKVPFVALQRAIARSEVRLAIGPAKGESWAKDDAAARASIQKWITQESPRASKFEAETMSIFEDELTKCSSAVANRDVDAMLALFPGKEMLHPLSNLAGFQSEDNYARAVYRGLEPGNYQPLVKVVEAVRQKLC